MSKKKKTRGLQKIIRSQKEMIQYFERKIMDLTGIPKDRMKMDRDTCGVLSSGAISRMAFPPLTDEEWDNFNKIYENYKNREICQHQ
jgi:hypothetical protein